MEESVVAVVAGIVYRYIFSSCRHRSTSIHRWHGPLLYPAIFLIKTQAHGEASASQLGTTVWLSLNKVVQRFGLGKATLFRPLSAIQLQPSIETCIKSCCNPSLGHWQQGLVLNFARKKKLNSFAKVDFKAAVSVPIISYLKIILHVHV